MLPNFLFRSIMYLLPENVLIVTIKRHATYIAASLIAYLPLATGVAAHNCF